MLIITFLIIVFGEMTDYDLKSDNSDSYVFVGGLAVLLVSLSCGAKHVSLKSRFEPRDYATGESVVIASIDGAKPKFFLKLK